MFRSVFDLRLCGLLKLIFFWCFWKGLLGLLSSDEVLDFFDVGYKFDENNLERFEYYDIEVVSFGYSEVFY